MIVLDASVTLAWYYLDEHAAAAERVLLRVNAEGAIVPELWRIEVANSLQMGVRRQRVSASYRDQCLAQLGALPIKVDTETHERAWGDVLKLAVRPALTVYDAAYFELAVRLELPIATLDGEIIAAARAEGVPVLP